MPKGREFHNLAAIQWEPLAILSTFELVLSCILTLLHLIEQSHIAALRFVCSFSPFCAHTNGKSLSIFHFHFISAFHSHFQFGFAASIPLFFVCVAFSEVFILQTPCLYLLLAHWPELSRKSFDRTLEILWRLLEFCASCNRISEQLKIETIAMNRLKRAGKSLDAFSA